MKVTIEIDMTAHEARKAMGLPDVSKMHEEVVDGLQNWVLADLPRNACGIRMDQPKSAR